MDNHLANRFSRLISPALVTAVLLGGMLTAPTRNAEAGSKLFARTTFQHALDEDESSASGVADLRKQGDKQQFSVKIRNLPGEDYGVFYSGSFGTNELINLIAALDGGTNNSWSIKFTSKNGMAPSQLLPFTDVEDMGGQVLHIGRPDGVVGEGEEEPLIKVVLQAEIPMLTDSPIKFKGQNDLTPPVIAAPSPNAGGVIKALYKGSKGASKLDLRVKNLPGAHNFSVWFETAVGSGVFTNLTKLTPSPTFNAGSFTKDTARGDKLPFDSATVLDLSGRKVQIKDAFLATHLEGTIP